MRGLHISQLSHAARIESVRPVANFMGPGPHSAADQLKIRIMDCAITRAEDLIGGPLMDFGSPAGLLERLQHIIKYARAHGVYARHYEIVWNLESALRDALKRNHVINRYEATPSIAGESA